MTRRGRLIAIDGVGAAALAAAASADTRARGRISRWDASGLFEQLAVADGAAGVPSTRTLLLLYAADLAFRIRWEIEPALAAGQTVVAAPYVETAVAFGRAGGLASAWLANLFRLMPTPDEQHFVLRPPRRGLRAREGFIECGSAYLGGRLHGLTKRQIVSRTRAQLQRAADRAKRRHSRA
jgi:thymidylate kinase